MFGRRRRWRTRQSRTPGAAREIRLPMGGVADTSNIAGPVALDPGGSGSGEVPQAVRQGTAPARLRVPRHDADFPTDFLHAHRKTPANVRFSYSFLHLRTPSAALASNGPRCKIPDQRLFCVVARGGVEPPTFRFSVGRSYQLSYLAAVPRDWRPRPGSNRRPPP